MEGAVGHYWIIRSPQMMPSVVGGGGEGGAGQIIIWYSQLVSASLSTAQARSTLPDFPSVAARY